MVWDWKAAFARRVPQGLEQVPFWLEQVRRAQPGSSAEQYALGVLREQLAVFGAAELSALAATGRAADSVGSLDPRVVMQRYPQGLGPIGVGPDGRLVLRCDPFGFPWSWQGAQVVSLGLTYARLQRGSGALTIRLSELAITAGRWPATMDEAQAMGLALPATPPGIAWRLDGRQVVIDLPKPTETPWTFPR
jgi:hypothetical protein